MNMIIDELNCVLFDRIGNIEFNTDFRTSILFELLMQDVNISKKAKIVQSLKLYYPDFSQISNIEKAIDDITWFYRCGKNKNEDKLVKQKNEKNKKQIYSYEFDDTYIYSAFLSQYNIDLQDIEHLHWWKFKALFEGLNKENKIVEIMEYRAIDLSKIKNKDERARYKKLKNLYKLPDMRTDEQKENDFADALW